MTVAKKGKPEYPDLIWNRAAPAPVFVVLLPMAGGGTTIAHRGSDGLLYGCRDVSAGPEHDSIVEASLDGAAALDHRGGATSH